MRAPFPYPEIKGRLQLRIHAAAGDPHERSAAAADDDGDDDEEDEMIAVSVCSACDR